MLAKTAYYPVSAIAAFLAAASYSFASPDAAATAPAAAYHDDGQVHPVSALGASAVKPEGFLHLIAS